MSGTPKFIVVSGIIGVGKSRLTKDLADHLGYEAIFEPVESNPYLARFYKDPKTWAYPMQEYLKHRRFAAYQYAYWGIRHGAFKGIVLDRSIHEDTVFAEINRDLGNIDDLNWKTYLQGFQDFQAFLPEPDLYLFLDAPPEECLRRVGRRDRVEETGLPLDYLKTLHAGYLKWLDAIATRVPVAVVDWREFLPVDRVWQSVTEKMETRSRFTRSVTVGGLS